MTVLRIQCDGCGVVTEEQYPSYDGEYCVKCGVERALQYEGGKLSSVQYQICLKQAEADEIVSSMKELRHKLDALKSLNKTE